MAKRIRKVKTRAKSMSKHAKLLRRRKYLAALRNGRRKDPRRVAAGKKAARKRARPIHTAASRRKISLALKAYYRTHKRKRRSRR